MPIETSPNHTQTPGEASAPQENQTAAKEPATEHAAEKQQEQQPPAANPPAPTPQATSGQQWTFLQQWTSSDKSSPPAQWSAAQHTPPTPPQEGPEIQDKAQPDKPKEDANKDDPKPDVKKDDPKPEAKKEDPKPEDKKDEAKAVAAAKTRKRVKYAIAIVAVIVLVGVGLLLWELLRPKGLGPGFASGNGRIEAIELFVSSKVAGRINDMYVDDGDSVTSGQIVARIDSDLLQTELQKTRAEQAQARNAVETALAVVRQHESEKIADEALVAQRYAELKAAMDTAHRSEVLSEQHATSTQEHENDVTRVKQSSAEVASSEAQVAAAQATIVSSQSQVLGARSNVDAAIAQELNLKTQIADDDLKAARSGRVQFRIVQPGEVVGVGGKVLSMIDLGDVTMTFFLPEEATGKVRLGSEVHIVLDADPSLVIPATVSFVGSVAQFTPKTVETQIERQKLVFRIKARIDPTLLRDHLAQVKSGLPGVAYVRLDASAAWPDNLKLSRSAP
jgi:HlyD family secretion protein